MELDGVSGLLLRVGQELTISNISNHPYLLLKIQQVIQIQSNQTQLECFDFNTVRHGISTIKILLPTDVMQLNQCNKSLEWIQNRM